MLIPHIHSWDLERVMLKQEFPLAFPQVEGNNIQKNMIAIPTEVK